MKVEKWPLVITDAGVSARIRKVSQIKNGGNYQSYVVDYFLLGERKQKWHSDLNEARSFARDACRRVAQGQHLVLQLTNEDRLVYLRALESLKGLNVPLDVAAAELAEARNALQGKGTLLEAARELARRRSVTLQPISVPDAVKMFKKQMAEDGKTRMRQKDFSSVLGRLANSFNIEVQNLTPRLLSDFLTALPFKERTKRNHRDVIGYFNRWLVLREFLQKGTDLLEGVQNYSARKIGEITTYSPEELALLLQKADPRILPFLAIAGFAGLRHAEIARLDWSDIDLNEGFIEVAANKSKTDVRRIVPIKENLKAWLQPISKPNGKVMEIVNIAKDLGKLARKAGIKWKHNALRHTYISSRVAECADVARVADEAGNSPQIIRTNYLKRIRPAQAAAWFNLMPKEPSGEEVQPPEQKAA